EVTLNGFIGGDGIGANYNNKVTFSNGEQDISLKFDWYNLQGFLIGGFKWNPNKEMLLKTSVGAGFRSVYVKGDIHNVGDVPKPDPWPPSDLLPFFPSNFFPDPIPPIDSHYLMDLESTTSSIQARVDYDWDAGKGFLFAAGVQEFFNLWTRQSFMQGLMEIEVPPDSMGPGSPAYYINRAMTIGPNKNDSHALSSAAYTLLEYKTPNQKFGAELGLRVDHFFVAGEDFSIQSMPAFNPRINVDFNLLKNESIFDSIDFTAGTGLFSSMTDNTSSFNKATGIKDFELKQNRSWTSLLGAKINFLDNYSFNIEAYYKYVFDRHYTVSIVDSTTGQAHSEHYFNGESHIAGFDVMLQKLHSRYIDGWIAYTFIWARMRNPFSSRNGELFENEEWRWPSYHRFHNLNVVMNIKPAPRYNIALRLGFASGAPRSKAGKITAYPVLVERGSNSFFMQKYKRQNEYSDTLRDGFTIPLDIKISFFTFRRSGKTHGELYLAAEGVLAFLKTRESNKSFDQYTGKEVEGSDTANYQMPVPMISFGYTWSY
ncbi:MAG: hypothetical protein LBG79_05530, partial [Spirochaetaceae bacterium]|nr:hypothetical protein [Spirochaetaceae bacterium]